MSDKFDQHERTLQPYLTDDFLRVLAELVRTYGNTGESIACRDLYRYAHQLSCTELPMPDTTPYDEIESDE